MRNLILFGLFIILLLAVQFTSAKTVDEVIEKYLRARGGINRLVSMKSIYMEGTKEIMGEEAIVKVIKEQGKLSRTDIETSISNDLILITDKAAWTFFSQRSPVAEKMPDDELAALKTETDIAGPLVDYLTKGHKAALLGKETIDGNSCYKIKLTTSEGNEILYWIDAASYLVVQSAAAMTKNLKVPGGNIITIYKNYKAVDGIQFAHTIETRTSGSGAATINDEIFFYKIIFNTDPDPKMLQFESQS